MDPEKASSFETSPYIPRCCEHGLAGLFSASLTAFAIESYKTLTLDSGGATVALLDQISKQLAASASGTAFAFDPTGRQSIGDQIKDKILSILLTFALPPDAPPSTPDFSIINVLISDFNEREDVGDILRRGDYDAAQIWSGATGYLKALCPGSNGTEDTLKTIKDLSWLALMDTLNLRYDEHTCTWHLVPGTLDDSSFPWFEESILTTICSLSIEPSPASPAVIVMLKTQMHAILLHCLTTRTVFDDDDQNLRRSRSTAQYFEEPKKLPN
ncbi:hypothetical protein C8R47DRAFT_1276918 [Mycena vitilis]|nr:hypothetical protein C8R47DRAFT_1276918 [Mycena vitilis]